MLSSRVFQISQPNFQIRAKENDFDERIGNFENSKKVKTILGFDGVDDRGVVPGLFGREGAYDAVRERRSILHSGAEDMMRYVPFWAGICKK